MSKTKQDFWQWMYNCPVNHKIENDGDLEMTLTFFFEKEEDKESVYRSLSSAGIEQLPSKQ